MITPVQFTLLVSTAAFPDHLFISNGKPGSMSSELLIMTHWKQPSCALILTRMQKSSVESIVMVSPPQSYAVQHYSLVWCWPGLRHVGTEGWSNGWLIGTGAPHTGLP